MAASTGRLVGRRAVVTGASRGIGAALALRMAAEGADVAIVARTVDHHPTLAGSLTETAARISVHGGRVVTIAADLGDDADRARIIPEAVAGLGGPIDILVNNAAAAIYQPLADYPLKRRRLTFEVNVHTPLDLAQAVLPGMVERGEGWIINLSSGSARLNPGPPFGEGPRATLGIYGASKAALNRLTNALALELYGTGVRINTLEPRAAVLTEGADVLVGATLRPDQIEPVEAIVEVAIELCTCGPDLTGQVVVSLDHIAEHGLVVHELDGSPQRT
ncbi:MAG: gno [Ilumatobacteraceae bacterium]|nr:gno [Ilumatobacteraceae bacterium]